MDQKLINQLQFYTPKSYIDKIISNPKNYLQIAKYVIDREFKHKPQRWKTVAFPEYEDFFQAAISGYDPYKKSKNSKDKGLLQAIESYNPYKKQQEVDGFSILETINGTEQAICPFCKQREEQISLWPNSAGNPMSEVDAPEPIFHKGHKYCGKQIQGSQKQLEEWLAQDLIRKSGKKYLCNYKSRLASLKNYISSQINYLVKDIRNAEYHHSRSLKRHPFYPCPKCNTLNPDFNTSTVDKTESLVCVSCNHQFDLSLFKGRQSNKIVYQARGATNMLSFNDHSSEVDGSSTYEEVITNYAHTSTIDTPSVHHNTLEEEKNTLFLQLIDRIRELSAISLSKKQYQKLIDDPEVTKVNGVPETQNFKIFYEYFFIDDVDQKQTHYGKTKDVGDESSTYRNLAYKYLKKEQHYSRCNDCDHKMYEPTESGKFKKAGPRSQCEVCESTNVFYHGPKCGRPGSANPDCKEHGDIEIVMYIFQTIEPKIRRLEELVKNDDVAQDLYERINELLIAKEELGAYQDMAMLLNY